MDRRGVLTAHDGAAKLAHELVLPALGSAQFRGSEARRRNKVILGVEKEATLEAFASHHLLAKSKSGSTSKRWMEQTEKLLGEALAHFGKETLLTAVSVEEVRRWSEQLAERPGRKGETVSPGTVRHRLNVLSNLYRRAASEGYVPPGYNPVAAMMDKPTPEAREAHWLEPHDAALLTGGRKSEVLGLEVDDVSFQRKTITFRPNEWRRLKTRTSHRPVRLWPQLEEILRDYLLERERLGGVGTLLFPSVRGKKETMVRDLRKALDAVAKPAGWKAGEIRLTMLRHAYCAARLQSLDGGAPVAPWTVARELGHSSTDMVERIYGHLGQVRHRGEGVSFHVDDYRGALGDRLTTLEAGAGAGT